MKKLIYKNATYYISDDASEPKGKTYILKYIANKDNMPHKHFADYIVVYGRKSCPYCIKTIDILKPHTQSLFVEIDTEPNELFTKQNLLNTLQIDIKGHSTVPIVFDKCKFIGGASDAETYFTV
jgi:glutaredoxin